MKSNTFNLNIVSKYRSSIYGLAIFLITLFHAYAINKVDYSFGHTWLNSLKEVMEHGNVSVDCFLFLSGISLYYSYHKNRDLSQYIYKRLQRIWLPVVLIWGWYWMLLYFLEGSESALVSRMLMLRFWQTGDQSIWFVSLMLVLYPIYPFIYTFIYKHDNIRLTIMRTVTLLVVAYAAIIAASKQNEGLFNMTEIATTRIPIFVFGCGCGQFVYEGKTVSKKYKTVPVFLLIVFVIGIGTGIFISYRKRFFYAVGGIGITYCVAFVFNFLTRGGNKKSCIESIFSKLGEFSLEIYLSSIMWNQMLRKWNRYEMGTLPLYLMMLVVAYLFAYLISRLEKIIIRKIEDKRCMQG